MRKEELFSSSNSSRARCDDLSVRKLRRVNRALIKNKHYSKGKNIYYCSCLISYTEIHTLIV